jgi:DNA invertase Pin-like site-specific DNA recombinase
VQTTSDFDKIAYARVSTADQNPDLQLDALAAEGYLKIYTDVATGPNPTDLSGTSA